MTTGEKIKKLRLEKMMTQAQLVGTHITRNMLSRIESDEASPSLQTLLYLASRLNVPAGYLLADEKEDKAYAKSFALQNIKSSFKSGDYKICRQFCLDFEGTDDEIMLLFITSVFAIAVEEFDKGNLKRAIAFFDEVISCSQDSEYYTENLRSAACMYIRYMRRFSPNLSSSVIDEDNVEYYCAMNDRFCRYIHALETLEEASITFAEDYIKNGDYQDPTVMHVSAKIEMRHGNFKSAFSKLLQLLTNNREVSYPVLCNVFMDLEVCAREINDFKSAYEFSNSKLDLLQKMLSGDE